LTIVPKRREKMNKNVLLIGFYNEKALGVRYLANALNTKGYNAHILYFKEFNSVYPSKASERELDLLEDLINVASG
jgi:anaerobic magnesium-protoporphyrin IX monomethyl ester cyclase